MLLTCIHSFNNTHTPLQPVDICKGVFSCPPPSSQNSLFLYPVNHQPPWLPLKLHYRPPVHSRTEHDQIKACFQWRLEAEDREVVEGFIQHTMFFSSALLFYSLPLSFFLSSISLSFSVLPLPLSLYFILSIFPLFSHKKDGGM